jgi:F0F1-type ATP synthase assembly protein I
MSRLPSQEEQDALLDALGAVVAVRGSEPLLRAPVEPSPEFFPDVWKPNLQGAEVVLRRLMFYAGLGDLDCRIDSGDGRTRSFVDAARGSHRTSGAAAWFWGIGDGAAWFGVDRKTLKDAEHLVAAMGHEVAHAYRRRYQVEGEPETEELRTDVTTIFLGFGILNTNASARTRTQGEVRGQRAYHQTSHTWLGYLAPESMAFLLAAQAVARKGGWRERRRIAGLLEPNQAASFAAAHRRLCRDEATVLRRLGIPADRRPLPARMPTEVMRELPQPSASSAGERASRTNRNMGVRVFRVPREVAASARFMKGMLLGVVAGAVLRSVFQVGYWALVVLPLVGCAIGAVVARARREYECSVPECATPLRGDAALCPGCGGTIVGNLRNRDQRLEALERIGKGREG